MQYWSSYALPAMKKLIYKSSTLFFRYGYAPVREYTRLVHACRAHNQQIPIFGSNSKHVCAQYTCILSQSEILCFRII